MILSKICEDFAYKAVGPAAESVDIADMIYDSRTADVSDKLFVCLKGARSDGHDYAEAVYARGCRAFLTEKELPLPSDATQIVVENSREAMAYASAAFFAHPARSLVVIGITGTKGKPTTAELVRAILEKGGIKTAYIGTTGIRIGDEYIQTKNTTPESYELHKAFRKMVEDGMAAVVMEVSSQAIFMHRVDGIRFHIGVFTNLSHDHIGGVEHPTFEHYMQCKAALFKHCRCGIFNADDPHCDVMMRQASALVVTFGMREGGTCDVNGRQLGSYRSGNALGENFSCKSKAGEHAYSLRIPGAFNIYNALAAIAVAEQMQINPDAIHTALKNAAVSGRFETIEALPDAITIIDYAHNRASMEAALQTLSAYQPKRLIVLFGSIGDRAKERRADQAEVVSKYADLAIITTDNPGHEPPEEIIAEIEAHMSGCPYVSFVDRREAVRYAISHAKAGDLILFAGKGHEKYQIIGGDYLYYNEREEILAAVESISAAR